MSLVKSYAPALWADIPDARAEGNYPLPAPAEADPRFDAQMVHAVADLLQEPY